MVIVTEIPRSMVVPSRRSVYKPCGVELANNICQSKLWVVFVFDLSPAFVVDNLDEVHQPELSVILENE